MTSEIRANTLKNRVGLGTISFTNTGPVVSGIVTANTLRLPDATSGSLGRVQLGNGLHFSMYHNGSNSFLVNNNGYLSIQSQAGVNGIFIARNAEVNLYFGPSVRLQTSSVGVTINKDLDVDGHTNLDNVSIAGVTTTARLDISSTTPMIDFLETDGNPDYRVYAEGGTFVIRDQSSVANRLVINSTGISVPNDLDVDGHTNLDNVSIAGVSTFAGNVVIADSIVHDGDTNTQIRFPADDTIRFEVANQQAVHILPASAGSGGARMGLGTNNPTGMLHIYGANPPVRIQNSNDSANLQMGMWDASNVMLQASHRPFKLATETSHPILFHTGGLNNERLRISSSGKVGIDMTNPDAYDKFVVSGTGNVIAARATSGAAGIGFFENNTGRFYIKSLNGSDGISFVDADNSSERLRITSDGYVGINETNPQYPLHVAGATTVSNPTGTGILMGLQHSHAVIHLNALDNMGSIIDFTVPGADRRGGILYYHSNNSVVANRDVMQFVVNSTNTGMLIQSNGVVTKPAHPAFIAGRTGGNQTFTVGTYPLNVARLNNGNHYSTSTYKFTAPVAGVYYFYGQVYYNNGSGAYRVGFRKTPIGGTAIMLNTAGHEVVGNDDQQNTSIIESLAVGDTVELYCDSNVSMQCYYNINDATYGAHTYFMGYLVG